MNKTWHLMLSAAVLLGAAACAKVNTASTGEKARKYLELWIADAYPGATPDQWGLYILEDTPGTGEPWNKDLAYSSLTSTIRTTDGTISATSDAQVAKQLGTYMDGNYYGPKYQATGSGSGYAGLEYMLTGMRVGGTRTAVIPAWLLTSNRYSTLQEYLNACTSSTHLVYTVKLEGQCNDLLQMQKDSLRSYVTRHWGADVKSCTYKSGQEEGIFYFISDSTAFEGVDPRANDTSLKLNYTGRMLNGQLFDTNVRSDALQAGLYSSSATYNPVTIKFASTYNSIAMDGSTSLIDGFQGALYKMHWAGQKAVAVFVSDLGYAASGSGDKIPPYSPLQFELELIQP